MLELGNHTTYRIEYSQVIMISLSAKHHPPQLSFIYQTHTSSTVCHLEDGYSQYVKLL